MSATMMSSLRALTTSLRSQGALVTSMKQMCKTPAKAAFSTRLCKPDEETTAKTSSVTKLPKKVLVCDSDGNFGFATVYEKHKASSTKNETSTEGSKGDVDSDNAHFDSSTTGDSKDYVEHYGQMYKKGSDFDKHYARYKNMLRDVSA